ncbi:efflux RND transporter permease subunit [Stenotrophomonas sp. MH181796]|uniref:efflux RND transporter permease subunit n=1 Tax=Stenotrophomonas sp. MH181796 TaxID=2339228 RepID=UPI00129C8F47|nr:efflux RND transporter permease subunit [Stenotrophomonas sp. MH181796]MRI42030.1 efflux RND transporter permease subunit [Stenotrophomonas sp. MH181796]
MSHRLALTGRLAAYFQNTQITPLLALVALLLGVFAILVTPREEEPQIDVTIASVTVPFPGASVVDVEQMVTIPAEQFLSRIEGVKHVMAVTQPGIAILTVEYHVGVPREEAVVRLNETLSAHADRFPQGLGIGSPLVEALGVDDVPIVALTLFSRDDDASALDLQHVAHSIETELKRVPGARDVYAIGGPGRAINIELDAERMASRGLAISDLRHALQTANVGMPVGELLGANRAVRLEAGTFLGDAQEVSELVVGVHDGRPVYLRDVATVRDGARPATQYVWHGEVGDAAQTAGREYPAITLAITKKPGENAISVANALVERMEELKNTLIPHEVETVITRNYGATANDKAQQLMQKLLFATVSVVALVFLALGRREAAIVGVAVVLTLAATLFASWAWGFTLNRVSLFALIFSIGILVDDAIVVVENIHRHQALYPEKTLAQIIPGAVDEVGGATILAAFAVIAALLPMAFVTGLMGPYMSPIPINASMGMLLSLAIAFTVTPWLCRIWMKKSPAHAGSGGLTARMATVLEAIFKPLLDAQRGARRRLAVTLGALSLVGLSLALPVAGLVILKMLPFDNKSELQIMLDMPAGTPLEQTASVLRELSAYVAQQPEVTDWQAYAGTSAPITFNGLVRQYALRRNGDVGDLQVNMVGKADRSEQSHAVAMRMRPELQAIAARYGADLKVVEVPSGPPVLAPIVAEVYGPDAAGRKAVAEGLRAIFESTPGVVDVDDSSIEAAPRTQLVIDRSKAALLGVSQQDIVTTLQAGLSGDAATWLHNQSKYPVPTVLQLPAERHGDLDTLLQLRVRTSSGQAVPIREFVTLTEGVREQPAFRKDLLPVHYVTADMAGKNDSPLYGMFAVRDALSGLQTPNDGPLVEAFIEAPADTWRDYGLKWDGEWQITYETFRDMGAAYAVGLLMIYLLVVAQFRSYLTPLIIMAPIPLTLIGVMPGHALLGAKFTATSMIGMIALAGIIVRHSILLVDFIRRQVEDGVALEEAVMRSAITRAQPILLTGIAAMAGAFFILDDPIFNGLAISLIFGILVSALMTLVLIPLLYYMAYRGKTPTTASPARDI